MTVDGEGARRSDDPNTVAAAPETAPEPSELASVEFTFDGQSWIEVQDARGRRLMRELVSEAGNRVLEGVPPFQIVIGDVTNVELSYQGDQVDLENYARQGMARFELGGS